MIKAENILAKVDIVDVISRYIPITTRGKSLTAICPFHEDHSPSLSISRDKQIFKCFACGTGGNAITFVQKYENISYREALEKVAEYAGIQIEKTSKEAVIPEDIMRLYKINEEVSNFANYMLKAKESEVAMQYLKNRNMQDAAYDKFQIGYIPDKNQLVTFLNRKGFSEEELKRAGLLNDNGQCFLEHRITYPIKNAKGYIAGFTARKVLENDPFGKYMNSPENEIFHKSNLLYNLPSAMNQTRNREVILTEGTMDVIALDKVGIHNGVAPLSTALTAHHVEILKKLKLNVCLCYDGDRAGREAIDKSYKLLSNSGITPRIVIMPLGKDPDELSIANPDQLVNLLKEKNNIYDFYLKTMPTFDNFQDKQSFILNFMNELGKENVLYHDEYLHQLSKKTNLEFSTLKQKFESSEKQNFIPEARRKVVEPPKEVKVKKKSLIKFEVKQKLEYQKELKSNFDAPNQKYAVIAFDQDSVLQRADILEKYIYLRGPVLTSVITCLDEKDIEYKAQSLCRNAIKSFCEENKIAKANISTVAFLHKDTTYPHIHLQMWQKEPYLDQYELNANFLEKLQRNIDEVLSSSVDLTRNPLIEQETINLVETTTIGV